MGANNESNEVVWRPSTEKPPKDLYVETGFKQAWIRSWKSPYLLANIVYIIYAALILSIDLHPDWETSYVDNMFIGAAVVHVINAMMYIWVWLDAGYPLRSPLMIPEFLNICEASLYLATACMYSYESSGGSTGSGSDESNNSTLPSNTTSLSYMLYSSDSPLNTTTSSGSSSYDPILHDVQAIELTASIIEMLAAIGWVTTWYLTYQRVPGRGFTLDDPDMWANFTIITPAILYIIYNVQLQLNPNAYSTDYLYVVADKIYMVNALLYFLAGMRDAGWFWFMPTSGTFPSFSHTHVTPTTKADNDSL